MRIVTILVVAAVLGGCGGSAKQAPRPDLQRVLDSLVAPTKRVAPGATAYVEGPKGSWSGSAGWANVAGLERMEPDARLRLESVSKLWTATVVLKLAEEGKLGLDDTVERWLPGRLPFGREITVAQLLDHTSGMLDNNDVTADPAKWFGLVHDARLHARLLAVQAALARDPAAKIPVDVEIDLAGAVGLLFTPGTQFHYSNIGYMILGRIAERAAGESLATLYERVIIDPLGLKSADYAPGPSIPGEHPVGYLLDGTKTIAATDWGAGALSAEGGIVSSAADEARFLVALARGEILSRASLRRMETPTAAAGVYGLGTGVVRLCGAQTLTHNGGGVSWSSSVGVSADGTRVAVLLLNGRTADTSSDAAVAGAMQQLLCAA